jgi:hypothetical protein
MPGSSKKNSKSGEAAAMPNTRQQESTRKEREKKRKGDDNLIEVQPKRKEVDKTNNRDEEDETVAPEPVLNAPNIIGETRDESRGIEADVEWKGAIGDMEEAMEAFKERPKIKKKMAEIRIDFTQAYDLWAQEFGFDEGQYE